MFFYRIHVTPVPVLNGAPETKDADPIMNIDLVVNADTSFRGLFVVAFIVVAVYIQKRKICTGNQKRKIIRVQISAGQDQINISNGIGVIVVPQGFGFPYRKPP